jgi:hypothetical protein
MPPKKKQKQQRNKNTTKKVTTAAQYHENKNNNNNDGNSNSNSSSSSSSSSSRSSSGDDNERNYDASETAAATLSPIQDALDLALAAGEHKHLFDTFIPTRSKILLNDLFKCYVGNNTYVIFLSLAAYDGRDEMGDGRGGMSWTERKFIKAHGDILDAIRKDDDRYQ